MIACEQAEQSINLLYSVVKFLKFEGFYWQSDSLPLTVHPLGEPVLIQVDLRNDQGVRITDALWDRGWLSAPFQAGVRYSLSLRLEYRSPFQTTQLACDFTSIHPRRYRFALDYVPGTVESSATVALGSDVHELRVSEKVEKKALADDVVVETKLMEGCGSILVEGYQPVPFGHAHFPLLSLPQTKKR